MEVTVDRARVLVRENPDTTLIIAVTLILLVIAAGILAATIGQEQEWAQRCNLQGGHVVKYDTAVTVTDIDGNSVAVLPRVPFCLSRQGHLLVIP